MSDSSHGGRGDAARRPGQGRLAKAAALYRNATTDAARAAALEALSGLVRDAVIAKIRGGRYEIDEEDLDEVAQLATEKVVRHVTEGTVTPGSEKAFIGRTAFTVLMDWFRKRGNAVHAPLSRAVDLDDHVERPDADPPPLGQRPPTPEDEYLEEERKELLRRRFQALLDALDAAPESYRRVIDDIYVRKKTLEQCTDEELRRRFPAGVPPGDYERERSKARATVDARHSRAKRWLRQQVTSGPGGDA